MDNSEKFPALNGRLILNLAEVKNKFFAYFIMKYKSIKIYFSKTHKNLKLKALMNFKCNFIQF